MLPVQEPTRSYWIEGAASPLRDCRTTGHLPKETDVVIIGSGYSGATIAYWLQKYTQNHDEQPRMVLLEARDLCGAATGRNGGHLRPHAYSRYLPWKERFGAKGALELIEHEVAHLDAFKSLASDEGSEFTEEVCLKFGETFDAAMTDEAWTRLKNNYEAMKEDHGEDNDIVKTIRVISDSHEAEAFSQMKGAQAAIVHPAGQIWPYKFVHAILRILLKTGKLNVQAHTPATSVSERDSDGWIIVTTDRGEIRARAVAHATNRWASHLLPEFRKLIHGDRGTLAAVKAPEGFLKHTGAQHWDAIVNNYHLQLPSPSNAIILGGARQFLVHRPEACFPNDEEDKQIEGIEEFFQSWPASDVAGWVGTGPAELARDIDDGGVWTGIEASSIDSFPFVGPVPDLSMLHAPTRPREGHFIAAGFAGHGMPRILGSTAHLAPYILKSLNLRHSTPPAAALFPSLPKPFRATPARLERLLNTANVAAKVEAYQVACEESARKPFCSDERCRGKL
ncbi:hypothetical protein DOTSEDRAFT_150512 [Dothistroma septosporum NZE10]|uniref:FAD dependent oxidoreductase domain-containing protein n=1 Tax=Dothistroma septosporum (strain NZE10 / CBS 128990) TaxID=675120 RepID=N1PPU4_DOTSN|nr:hypothetical protein DOTSEDRAFT_150512 [Dothistroma septosporum NZE10]